jgi:hypothetical protein
MANLSGPQEFTTRDRTSNQARLRLGPELLRPVKQAARAAFDVTDRLCVNCDNPRQHRQ